MRLNGHGPGFENAGDGMDAETPRSRPTATDGPGGRSHCPRCGAVLGDLRLGRCAACGQEIDAAAELRFRAEARGRVRMESPGAIDFGEPISAEWDLRCTRCGYSLTGLTSRVCPECGQAFRPRQTWLANRQLDHEVPAVPRRWVVKAAVAALAGLVAGAVLYRAWFGGAVAWGALELVFWKSQWDPWLMRAFFIAFLVLSAVLIAVL